MTKKRLTKDKLALRHNCSVTTGQRINKARQLKKYVCRLLGIGGKRYRAIIHWMRLGVRIDSIPDDIYKLLKNV